MKPSFMLGYFDGDGCVYLQKRFTGKPRKITNMNAVVDIVSNRFIISEMVAYFRRVGIVFKTKVLDNPHYPHMYICSTKNIRAFYDHVYAHYSYFLKRKHDRFLEFFHYKATRGYGKKVEAFEV